MNKKYKAIFFDWDGTAVTSRTAPVEDAVVAMKPLLQQGTKLVIVSGTTYDKIAGGKFHTYFTEEEQKNLFFGLGRGAYNYQITDDRPEIFASMIPDQEGLLKIHDICYAIHVKLLWEYGLKQTCIQPSELLQDRSLWWKTTVETSFSCRAMRWNIYARS